MTQGLKQHPETSSGPSILRASGELPPAEAVRLADLVQYVPGSIVSRVLAKNDGGTMTVFSFDAGQGLSEHSAPFDAVVQVLDGAATLTIGGKPLPARTGDTVLMPANVPHAVSTKEPFKMLLTMLRGARKP